MRDSGVFPGLGVWTRAVIPGGQKVGPFQGVLRPSVDDPSCAWEVSVFCLLVWSSEKLLLAFTGYGLIVAMVSMVEFVAGCGGSCMVVVSSW